MTEQFFGKELAARKIEAIPGLMEFDIPVHGDNRGWFKENFQKEKMLPLGFPEASLPKASCKITFLSRASMSYVVCMQNLGTSTFLWQMKERFLALG